MKKVAPAIYNFAGDTWGYYEYSELVECINNIREDKGKDKIDPSDVFYRFIGLNLNTDGGYLHLNTLKCHQYWESDQPKSTGITCHDHIGELVFCFYGVDGLKKNCRWFVPAGWGKRVLEAISRGGDMARRRNSGLPRKPTHSIVYYCRGDFSTERSFKM